MINITNREFVRLVRQAYPYRMITVTAAPTAQATLATPTVQATLATPAPPGAVGAAATRSDVKLDELAEADAEGNVGPSDQNDPFEDLNRVIFTVNDTLATSGYNAPVFADWLADFYPSEKKNATSRTALASESEA